MIQKRKKMIQEALLSHRQRWSLTYQGSWAIDLLFCPRGERKTVIASVLVWTGKKSNNFDSEPGFLKLRSPRGQLLAYLCTYLLLSLKRWRECFAHQRKSYEKKRNAEKDENMIPKKKSKNTARARRLLKT